MRLARHRLSRRNELNNHLRLKVRANTENTVIRGEQMSAHQEIVACKIHPGIGIARVGNSPNHYFIGPEAPGVNKAPRGGYKDTGEPSRGVPPRVKRQGARFRIFGYNSAGQMVREMKAGEVEITWTVHLANEKAEDRKST